MKRLMLVSDSQEQPLNTVDLTRFGNEQNQSGVADCAVLERIRFAHFVNAFINACLENLKSFERAIASVKAIEKKVAQKYQSVRSLL